MKKYSILGLVLLAASAVTAAFIPADPGDDVATQPGTLRVSSVGGAQDLTCRLGAGDACDYTVTTRVDQAGSATALDPGFSNTQVQGVFTVSVTTVYI